MQLQRRYSEKLVAIQQADEPLNNGLSDQADVESWFDVLALFEASFSQEKSKMLYHRLFDKGADFPANLYLDEDDYRFFVDKSRTLLLAYAPQYPEAWIELGLQHVLCRRSYVDKKQASFYLQKGIDAAVPAASALYFYYNALGILTDMEKEVAISKLNGLAHEGDLWAVAYNSHLEIWKEDFESVYEQIQPLAQQAEEKIQRHYYETLQYYHARRGELDLQRQALEEGIKRTDSSYCKFVLAELKRREATSADQLDALIPSYLLSFETGITDAAVQIALIKLSNLSANDQKVEDYRDIIFYLQKAWEYNNSYAGYRLACLYLYNELLQDIAHGLDILEELQDNYDQADAQVELAEIYLEGRFVERDEQRAHSIFQQLADKEVPYAQLRLGNFHEYGSAEKQPDYTQAFSLYQQAAQAKLPQALYQVGRYLKYGIHNGEPDLQAAMPYFEEAAAADNAVAITELGIAQELLSPPNYPKAFRYFTRAAELGYPYAYFLQGVYLEYDYHQSGQKHPEEAFESYSQGAAGHDLSSIYELARCYRFGVGTEANLDQAMDLYRQAAERNHAQALTDLALCHEYGYGVAKNDDKALEYIAKAVDLGYAYAYYVMGRYYVNGLVEQRTEEGLALLERASAENIAEAKLLLGDYYFFDYDQRGEYNRAFDYYKQAEELGHLTDGLGMCYEFGAGVEANAMQAFKYYQMAAENGNDGAIYRLGRCFYFGIGTDVDKEKAFQYYEQSGQQGNIYARYFAGLQLLQGDGVLADQAKGAQWIQDAAEGEYAEAQYQLGNCYLMGDGVEENEDIALHWFQRAAENGHEQATRIMKGARG